jgi:hypothetical protein
MRIQNEQSGSTSLFAQPMVIEPVPEATTAQTTLEVEIATPSKLPRGILEGRMEVALKVLSEPDQAPSPTLRQGHLALLKRWYYRPEVRRAGEIFFPDPEGQWPVKAMLRGAGRVAAKMLAPGIRA